MRHWYDDAIMYELDVETFQDSNADGIGDFPGLTSRLEYLCSLGVNTLWLMPIYPTPNGDNGYDVSDYRGIDPRLGTLEDFRDFTREAERHGLRVILDLPLNHTSDQHEWFRAARRDRHSPYRDYYVWRDEPPDEPARDTPFAELQDGNWAYAAETRSWYYHTFYPFQPDLNTAHPRVQEELQGVLNFWLDQGVSGFRLDAVPFLIHKDGVREPWELLRKLCSTAKSRREEAVLLGEVDVHPSEVHPYFTPAEGAHGLDLLLNFHLCAHLFLGLARGSAEPIDRALRELPTPPLGHRWANFLRNNDELNLAQLGENERAEAFELLAPQEDMRIFGRGVRRRLWHLLNGERARVELATSLLLTLPGVPVLLYGDEIGLGDDLSLPERNSARTSMQWEDAPAAGFSTTKLEQLERPVITRGPRSYRGVNVAMQDPDPSSLLNCVRRAVHARRECPEFGRDAQWHPRPCQWEDVLVHTCRDGSSQVWALHNLGRETRRLEHLAGQLSNAQEVFADREYGPLDPTSIEIGPSGYRWLRLDGLT